MEVQEMRNRIVDLKYALKTACDLFTEETGIEIDRVDMWRSTEWDQQNIDNAPPAGEWAVDVEFDL